jgi:hypothetical protein
MAFIVLQKQTSVLLYWYESWCFALREQHRLSVFENRALMRTFGPKAGEGGWRKLPNEGLHTLYS